MSADLSTSGHASAKSDPLAPAKLDRACKVANAAAHHCLVSTGSGEHAFRALWVKATQDRRLSDSLALVYAAFGGVSLDGDPQSSFRSATASFLDEVADPLSAAKVRAAGEVYTAAALRAIDQLPHGADTTGAARRLVWAWSRRDEELRLAMVRLSIWGRTVTVLSGPGAAVPAAETVH